MTYPMILYSSLKKHFYLKKNSIIQFLKHFFYKGGEFHYEIKIKIFHKSYNESRTKANLYRSSRTLEMQAQTTRIGVHTVLARLVCGKKDIIEFLKGITKVQQIYRSKFSYEHQFGLHQLNILITLRHLCFILLGKGLYKKFGDFGFVLIHCCCLIFIS